MKTLIKNLSWRAIRVWQRNLDVYKATWKVNFIPPVLEPILYLFAFGIGIGALIQDIVYQGQTVSYLQFIAPGLVASSIMNHGFFETTYSSFVRMYYQKTYDAILSTPLLIEDVIAGEILWGATKSLFAAFFILIVTCSFGLIGIREAFIILPISFIAGLTFSSLGMLFTSLVKNIEMFNFPVFLFITPMFLFSGVFYPLSSLPQWAQHAAYALPLTFLVSAIRSLTLRNFHIVNFYEIILLFFLSIIFMIVSMALMKRRILK